MTQLNVFFTILVLNLMASAAATARAADGLDDLEVTMQVLDDASELKDTIAEMESPDDDDIEVWEDESEYEYDDEIRDKEVASSGEEEFAEAFADEFEHDAAYEEDELEREDDFEDGEDVDEDAFDDE
jgi:Skp family chaperone for outer membrane proteins